MILMKKTMPGIRAVCKNRPFVQPELSVPPWQHSTAQLGLQLLGVTHGVPTVLGTQPLTLVGCGSRSALCNAPLCTRQCSACFSLAFPGFSRGRALAHLLLLYL